MSVLDIGSGETVKADVHLALLALAAICAGYNVLACWKRPARHLAVNAVLYASLAAYEAQMVAHHAKRVT